MSRTCVVRCSALSWTSERLDCQLWNRRQLPQIISFFGWWLQYSSFCDREEIQVNRNTNTSRDFIAWNSCGLTSWACYRGCWTKSKNDNVFLVGKWVRYTNITPVIYFALQTLNEKKSYFANLIFWKGGLSAGPSLLLLIYRFSQG